MAVPSTFVYRYPHTRYRVRVAAVHLRQEFVVRHAVELRVGVRIRIRVGLGLGLGLG